MPMISNIVQKAKSAFTHKEQKRRERAQAIIEEHRNSPTLTLGSVTIVNPTYAGNNPYRGPETIGVQDPSRAFIPIRRREGVDIASGEPMKGAKSEIVMGKASWVGLESGDGDGVAGLRLTKSNLQRREPTTTTTTLPRIQTSQALDNENLIKGSVRADGAGGGGAQSGAAGEGREEEEEEEKFVDGKEARPTMSVGEEQSIPLLDQNALGLRGLWARQPLQRSSPHPGPVPVEVPAGASISVWHKYESERGADPVGFSAQFLRWVDTEPDVLLIEKFRDENAARRLGVVE